MIYLASQSPRRRELLGQIGVEFETLAVAVDETPHPGEPPGDYARRLALEKARSAAGAAPARLPVLAADTVVVLDGEPMGKPAGRDQALAMLGRLSGRCHEVFTAVCLLDGRPAMRLNRSRVCFRPLTGAECRAYCETGEPYDKAGGYAIQGRAAAFVSYLEGSYSGVMGLPLYETAMLLSTLASAGGGADS